MLEIIAEPCKGHELKPGELWSTHGPEYWDNVRNQFSIGEKVYIRTEMPAGADRARRVFRIRVCTASTARKQAVVDAAVGFIASTEEAKPEKLAQLIEVVDQYIQGMIQRAIG